MAWCPFGHDPAVGTRRRRILFTLAAPALLLASLTPASLAHSSRTATRPVEYWPSTGFGGYRVHGRIREIGATWRSPAVRDHSRAGAASMWIGVQSAVAGSGFVQVGEVLTKANGQRGFGALFWSDTALHFRPQILWPVAPGDLIVTRIRRAGPIWDVSADDVTARYPYRIRVRASPQVRDDVGEWVLEDPPDSLSATSDGPFPALSDVRFTRLQFNDRPPRLTRSNGQILMSSDDGVFVPTPALADGFQMSRPHGFVARYLALADVADRALARFDDAWAHWQTLAPGAKRAAALAVARSYRASGRALAALP